MFRTSEENLLTGFQVSYPARDRYQFDKALFTPLGKTTIYNFHAARVFAQQMNDKRDLVNFPEQMVSASQINAVAMIHGITQYFFRMYIAQHPQLLNEAMAWLHDRFSPAKVDEAFDTFIGEFPPMSVYLREMDAKAFLTDTTGEISNREIVLEEVLMLWLSNSNPAFAPFFELFSDDRLERETNYNQIINELTKFFDVKSEEDRANPNNFTGGESILNILLAPARTVPHSLEEQLNFIVARWGSFIGGFVYRLLRAMDLIKEETKPVFFGTGPSVVPTYDLTNLDIEGERFSADREWMPNLVMIAKNAYVWLDQLSKKYNRPINRLDLIPDEELDQLASWGFTGLWLIGLWERSTASKTIKNLCGNPDAVASAYSLFDYAIAHELGGEKACDHLRRRAWQRGIRLASDMVPNHVGIDGKWVIEHPDWFVSLPYTPFPNYTFNGPDLSNDERVGIFLEDHYYTRSDAAVVFKRVDRWTGSEQYIYHGNDGTTMPWNDTAQLNYLNPAVRESMIQLIMHIARQFPIIRFDAAMTIVKRHFHRLWFPEPGSGGAIPSRSEHGMTKAQFESLMPEEFWREVVERAAVEAPDTLLLAEAFWLMESYFVRTLGMHRVYNSAFMNMMRDEDNAKYRLLMKNTLEFDPEVLRRYVNFMNNPDERTAVDQFGKDDKYIGICTLMLTIPGLPMFGHGQVEGFTEKYGMEYKRAYYDEQPDQYLIQRHERDIFPLVRRRYLFAGVENFLLYDFYSTTGNVNEDVFAHSNRAGDERGLVVYHNRYGSVNGWIRSSAAYSVRTGNSDERALVQRTLGEGLALPYDDDAFVIFRDHNTGLEYIRNSKELCDQGMYIELHAYSCYVFLDFRIVTDNATNQYRNLTAYLHGRGVPNITEALQELFVQPIREPFRELVNAAVFLRLLNVKSTAEDQTVPLDEIETKYTTLLKAIQEFIQGEKYFVPTTTADETETTEETPTETQPQETDLISPIVSKMREQLGNILHLVPDSSIQTKVAGEIEVQEPEINLALWSGVLSWLFVHQLGAITGSDDAAEQSRSWIDEWFLGRIITSTLQELGIGYNQAVQTLSTVKLATTHQDLLVGMPDETAVALLNRLLSDSDFQHTIGVNRFQEVLWFSKEAFDQFLNWLSTFPDVVKADEKVVLVRANTVEKLRKASDESGYQVEKLRDAVAGVAPKRKKPTKAK